MPPERLLSHYRNALNETHQATAAARRGDYTGARAALERRSTLIWEINAGSLLAPDWGSHNELDTAALALLKADRALDTLLLFVDA